MTPWHHRLAPGLERMMLMNGEHFRNERSEGQLSEAGRNPRPVGKEGSSRRVFTAHMHMRLYGTACLEAGAGALPFGSLRASWVATYCRLASAKWPRSRSLLGAAAAGCRAGTGQGEGHCSGIVRRENTCCQPRLPPDTQCWVPSNTLSSMLRRQRGSPSLAVPTGFQASPALTLPPKKEARVLAGR